MLEGFSGTGKTTLAKSLEEEGWLRLAESAHALPGEVPVGERANTYSDYSLFGATLEYSSVISSNRGSRNVVAEGYLLSDLAYARIRYTLNLSDAFPEMMEFARGILRHKALQPDLFILLVAEKRVIEARQATKDPHDKNMNDFFRNEYYNAIGDLHKEFGFSNLERVTTDTDLGITVAVIREALARRGYATATAPLR